MTALLAAAVCSALVALVGFPLLEAKISGFVNQLESGSEGTSKGGRMISESWAAVKGIFCGLPGGILIQTRRNELPALTLLQCRLATA
ncbi:hypothetical protein [Nocardia sp. NPDC002869]|uniref:hypothetical protein n=1 Tax=Nocardia sp. NPDC002869 TaxID=3161032 RepID=UPI00398C9532